MNEKRARLLGDLLREMRKEDGDYFPEEAWPEIHKTFALPYVELVVPRLTNRVWEIFLTRRSPTDHDWPSTWHLPGGLWRTSKTEREACESVAQLELGIELSAVEEVMTYKWTSHPRGAAISHVCICWPKEPIPIVKDGGFFSDFPTPFIQEQVEFVTRCKARLLEKNDK